MKKNLIRTLTLTAAALTAAAAYGQTPMTAKVPFSFRIDGATLPAGEYNIGPLSRGTRNVLMLAEKQTNKTAMALRNGGYEGDKGRPRLVFSCRETSGCVLLRAWDNQGNGWAFPKPRLTSSEKERIAMVPLHRSDAE
jgi:hypothetical protein